MALLELELQAVAAVGLKLNLGALDTLKYCSLLSGTMLLRNLVQSSEYCSNFAYLPYQICNIILKSTLEQNN